MSDMGLRGGRWLVARSRASGSVVHLVVHGWLLDGSVGDAQLGPYIYMAPLFIAHDGPLYI
jgi:hypothetical protein